MPNFGSCGGYGKEGWADFSHLRPASPTTWANSHTGDSTRARKVIGEPFHFDSSGVHDEKNGQFVVAADTVLLHDLYEADGPKMRVAMSPPQTTRAGLPAPSTKQTAGGLTTVLKPLRRPLLVSELTYVSGPSAGACVGHFSARLLPNVLPTLNECRRGGVPRTGLQFLKDGPAPIVCLDVFTQLGGTPLELVPGRTFKEVKG